jgi:pimeloyl-ACP methyl ester carboxylesterase
MNGMWTQETIAGKIADVFTPAATPRFAVFFLHGIGLETLRGNAVYTNIFQKRNLACVSPHGQRSWWLDRVCPEYDPVVSPEKHLLESVVPFSRERWKLGPRALGVFGISMGGQGALRLALRHPQVFPAAAGITSAIDFHEAYGRDTPLDDMFTSKEQCRQDTALMHIHPHDWPPHLFFCIDPLDSDWLRGNDRLHEKLSALGVPHTFDFTTSAGGHTWDYFHHMAEPTLRFLAEGLEKESRRLL